MEVADPLAGSLLSSGNGLLSISGKFALLVDECLSAETVLLVDLSSLKPSKGGIRVQVVHGFLVAKWVSLLDVMSRDIALLGTDGTLHFVAVNDSADVWVGNFSSWKHVALLLDSAESAGSEDVVEFLESVSSPDDEPTNMSSWGQLKKVQSANVEGFHTGNVSDCAEQRDVVTLVDDKGTSAAAVAAVAQLTQTGTDTNGVDDFPNVGVGSNVLEELNSFLCSFDALDLVINDERELRDLINSMSARLDQW